MDLIETYKTYRRSSIRLTQKIMDTCLKRDVVMKSAKLLGIVRGGTLIFESEDDTGVLMEFALYDYKVNNKNTIAIYRDTVGWENEIEKEILDVRLKAYSSLFKVISISKKEKTLLLHDILDKKDNITLIDISLSESAIPGMLLFTRLVPCKEFTMSSGISFAFPGRLEKTLLKRYKVLSRRVKSHDRAVKRFVSFFKLNKTKGIEVQYK